MSTPTLKRTSVQINYTASDGYRAEAGYNNAPRGKDFITPTPEVVFLDALEELARLTALFGFEDEALARFNGARSRVAAFKTGWAAQTQKRNPGCTVVCSICPAGDCCLQAAGTQP